ncbi:MAG: hypothetical protein LLG04_10330 [Parachlamydia sp.]|nr:hypothetical protein [Parachlamydia sp.]
MTNRIHPFRVPLQQIDPCQGRPSYKLKEAQEVEHGGRKYRILIYENRHHLGWQFLKGAQALLATVFTLFIGLAFKGVQNLWSQALSGKEIRLVKLASLEAKKVGLAATGGIENSGASCFIIATLQCARNIPIFWNLLHEESHPLTQERNETAEKFQLRLQIRQKLFNILSTTKTGKTVSAQEMDAFRRMLNQYSPDAISLNSPGDPREFWTVMSQILQSPRISTIEDGDSLAQHHSLPVAFRPGEFFKMLTKYKLDQPPLMLPASCLLPWNSIEPAPEIQFDCRGTLIRYRLAAFVQGAGHAAAYLKEGTGGWVKFDDATITPLSHLPEDAKQNIGLFFYEKC